MAIRNYLLDAATGLPLVGTTRTTQTPQAQPIPGRTDMVQNEAGGYVFQADDWTRLKRFLILGTEGGTFYANEKTLTVQNAQVLDRAVKADADRVFAMTLDVSTKGLALKQEPAIFALAYLIARATGEARVKALAAISTICRTGTMLFMLREALDALGVKWGRAVKNAFARWYAIDQDGCCNEHALDWVAAQVTKYQSRGAWSHRDILRLTHVVPASPDHASVLRWAVRGWTEEETQRAAGSPSKALHQIAGYEDLKRNPTPANAVASIRAYDLPRECIPTELLNSVEVWNALLHAGKHGMPITALIRNLAKMTAIGLFNSTEAQKFACDRLADRGALKAGRVHPFRLLLAAKVYQQGRGDKGSLTWTPNKDVLDALDAAFYASFDSIEPTGKRILVALDGSGSMQTHSVAGMANMSAMEAAAAFSLILLATEPNAEGIRFTTRIDHLPVNPRMRLDEALAAIRAAARPEGTNLSLPFEFAWQQRKDFDLVVSLTDTETWAGSSHPIEALKVLRQRTGVPTRYAEVAFSVVSGTTADPKDAGCLPVAGGSPDLPTVLRAFALGEL